MNLTVSRLHPSTGAQASASATTTPKTTPQLDVMDGTAPAKARGIQLGPQSLTGGFGQMSALRGREILDQKGFAGKEYVPASVEVDALNMVHIRMNRVINNIPVYGEQIIVHLRNGLQGAAADAIVTGTPMKVSREALGPCKVDRGQALEIIGRRRGQQPVRFEQAERVVYADKKTGEARAGYLVVCNDIGAAVPSLTTYLVDGHSGAVEEWNALPTLKRAELSDNAKKAASRRTRTSSTKDGKADDQSIYSNMVELRAKRSGDGYELEDETRGKGVITKDAHNAYSGSSSKPFVDNNDRWGEATDDKRQQGAIDAHYGAAMTYDFYKEVLGRDSIDGKGEALRSNVHIRQNYVNAYWDGSTMNYGDGDNKRASILTTLDIAGHEITHGLTERTASLVYRGESGGLNESYSDVGGTLVEWLAAQKDPTLSWNWMVGEACWTPANGNDDALRYMDNPTKDNYSVDHYSQYPKQTEVHGSSGIANNAFYQLAEPNNAGKVPNSISKQFVADGIGMKEAAEIWFRALIHYMGPNTTFAEARKATIQAAIDLHGKDSIQAKKTAEAWSVVGVE